eukprot:CAMPEP_0172416500 /NCGR_PEP_ID=MMETSP1064-20121228/2993_1 /TAXON_ID=202472 /ORGANISM="Aulacoseira subarctica , Strain CCAP 1002/5" /LENGTH=154 /DNA_ID=CAMNT_0013154209 /DNA_START=63 /DNA_END=527 /DNA_ORIENTATION=+
MMNRGICWKSANTAISSGRLSFLRRNTIMNGNNSVRFMGTSNMMSPKEGLSTVQPYVKSNMLVVRGENARNLISHKLRYFASNTSDSSGTTSSSSNRATGAGFFQRVSSFVIGAGVMALATQYFIHQEIVEGNKEMILKQREIEDRLFKLEKQK